MTLLEWIITYPNDPLTIAFKRACDNAVRKQRIAKTLTWWVPL